MNTTPTLARAAADLLDKAATRLLEIGWYEGTRWYRTGDDEDLNCPGHVLRPKERRPATARAHLHFAAGCDVTYLGCDCTDSVVYEAEQWLAQRLIDFGAEPEMDDDGAVDFGQQIRCMEITPGITVEEITIVMRDCADGIRARYPLPAASRKSVAA